VKVRWWWCGLWILLTLIPAAFFFWISFWETATLFGEEPTLEERRASSWYGIGGVLCVALGPFGIWIASRRRGWLITAGFVLLSATVGAIYTLWKYY
jgi:hypothetical protein